MIRIYSGIPAITSLLFFCFSSDVLGAQCASSDQVGLTKARQVQISIAQGTRKTLVERAFEGFALASNTTLLGTPLPRNTRRIASLERAQATGGRLRSIIPDSISPLLYLASSGVTRYDGSVFHEIKSVAQRTLPPSTADHQVTGYLDTLRRTPSQANGVPSVLDFLTTSDVGGSGNTTRFIATSRRIYVEHAIACEIPRTGRIPLLQFGPEFVQNLELFVVTGILPFKGGPGIKGRMPVLP
jgi:hypothetical protein